ncbi:DUF411 domain-containing protein [Calothrix sp. PCC 6303]|uniref:DUF411 domain-containing protein n=1 Tax=Calothrix sp. PCC 6303 TaxID=1170562 RepID=UPI0002A01980|nr:DUF411 domain-containing protein [Calothrix sp. PCC 6303]AFZ03636.1 protein of unknown function DUF411 [Calothrix sp. PCC 6303]
MRQKKSPCWQLELYFSNLPRFVAVLVMMAIAILGSFIVNTGMSYADTIAATNITVYHTPECSCCGGWIDHLKTEGFQVQDLSTDNIEAVKQNYKVPDNLTSCHTAIVNGYVIEGHVPASDIQSLLQKRPNIVGLSVPQMPVGTPGMEMGSKKDPFTVLSFSSQDKVEVFRDYPLQTN